MRAGYSTLSVEPSFKLLADSSPYCLYRNKENYQFRSEHLLSKGGDSATNHASSSSSKIIDDQVRLYNDSLTDGSIPSHLLYGALRTDALSLQERAQEQCWSSVAAVHHNRRNLFVHTSGQNMDQLVLRDTKHSYAGQDLRNPPGFTLSLGQGSPIQEIYSAGSTNWGYSSLLLARTRSEVYQLHTVSLEDRKTKANYSIASVEDSVMTTILEPMQKWQLPYDMCSMSTSPGNWSNAVLLTACGRVATWNPTDGVQFASSSRSSVLPSESLPTGMRDYSMRIDCTLHPQLSHIACDNRVHVFDLRTSSAVATALYTAPSHRILCSKQHGSEGHCFMVSTKNCVSLIDTRFAKTPLAQQYVPVGHEKMRYFANPLDTNSGLFVGSSCGSAQLLAHSLEKSCNNQLDAHESAQQLLSASRSTGHEGCFRWDVDGFPVVDAGTPQQGLMGFGLINLVDEDAHYSDENDESASNSESEEDIMIDNQSESDSSHLSSRLHRSAQAARTPKKQTNCTSAKAMLLQQSHRGDVFAQRVTWGVNPFRQARLGLLPAGPVGSSASQTGVAGLSTNAASLVAGAVSKKAPQRKPLKRKRPAHYLDSDDEEEEEESENEEASLNNTTSGNEQGKGISLPHSESRGLPPVQLNLPCGVRCFPPENTAVLSNTTSAASSSGKKESALKATKKYLKTVIRNNGLILLNAISANDSNPTAGAEQQQQTHLYPSSSSAFPDFVPEDSLHGFDLIKMYPEDLRSDLPALPSHAAIRMEQSSPAVTTCSAVDYIVQHYRKEVRGYLEKEAKTLWEIWRFLLNLTDGKRLDINQVRLNLCLASYGLIETMVPTCSVVSYFSDTADAKRNDADSNHSESDSDNSANSLASSDLDTPDHGDNKSLSIEVTQRRPRTFDGLYVREPCVDGSNVEVYRDTSKGREVRMSRRKSLPGDITAGAKKASTKSSGATYRCPCSQANLMSSDLSELTLCGEKGCLLPHLLVYRLDRKTDNSVAVETTSATTTAAVVGLPPRGRTPISKNNTTSAKPKADAFYWGTSLTPVTVPVSVTSETQKGQTQSQSQSQPMSQLRFHLSQFSQASQQPGSQSYSMSQDAPKLMSQSQALTPAARAPAPLPEVSLDVTDNILAVLGNQWNRSLEHTAFVDPARSSLVQAFLPS